MSDVVHPNHLEVKNNYKLNIFHKSRTSSSVFSFFLLAIYSERRHYVYRDVCITESDGSECLFVKASNGERSRNKSSLISLRKYAEKTMIEMTGCRKSYTECIWLSCHRHQLCLIILVRANSFKKNKNNYNVSVMQFSCPILQRRHTEYQPLHKMRANLNPSLCKRGDFGNIQVINNLFSNLPLGIKVVNSKLHSITLQSAYCIFLIILLMAL